MTRKLPDTSLSAYKQAKMGLIDSHKKKILEAMQVVGIANYEVIAAKAGLDRHACMRRLGEMEKDQVIFKPGTKTPTKSGRMAYDYCLTSSNTKRVEKTSIKEERSMHEFAEDIIKATNSIQRSIFD